MHLSPVPSLVPLLHQIRRRRHVHRLILAHRAHERPRERALPDPDPPSKTHAIPESRRRRQRARRRARPRLRLRHHRARLFPTRPRRRRETRRAGTRGPTDPPIPRALLRARASPRRPRVRRARPSARARTDPPTRADVADDARGDVDDARTRRHRATRRRRGPRVAESPSRGMTTTPTWNASSHGTAFKRTSTTTRLARASPR